MARAIHKEDVKAAIRKVHGTLGGFEAARSLPRGSVKDVLRGRSIARAERAIAEELRVSLHRLFPTRYAAESSTEVDSNTPDHAPHRLTREAA